MGLKEDAASASCRSHLRVVIAMSATKHHKQTPVGISPAFIKAAGQLASCANSVEAELGPDLPPLNPEEKRRSLRMRKGAEPVVRTIAGLAKTYGLDSQSLHSDDMTSHLELATVLAPLEATLSKVLKRISDGRFLANSNAWDMALQFYSLLQRRAPSDGQLAAALAPIADFFAYRHDLVLAKKPTKLQTRIKRKLAQVEHLAQRARGRVDAPQPAPVAASTPPTAAPATAAPPAAAPAHSGPNGTPFPTNGQG
jgi:hypothetical protein